MKPPQPIDNYTDSDDDDTVVIGSPTPPTPPKAQKGQKVKEPKVQLTIDTRCIAKDDDENTDSGEDYTLCFFIGWVMRETCISLRRFLAKIC